MRVTFMVVQWLRLCTPNAGGLDSTPGQGIRSHMLQLSVRRPQLKNCTCWSWRSHMLKWRWKIHVLQLTPSEAKQVNKYITIIKNIKKFLGLLVIQRQVAGWIRPVGNSLLTSILEVWGFPGSVSGKEPACQCKRHKRRGFDPLVGKIPWRKA